MSLYIQRLFLNFCFFFFFQIRVRQNCGRGHNIAKILKFRTCGNHQNILLETSYQPTWQCPSSLWCFFSWEVPRVPPVVLGAWQWYLQLKSGFRMVTSTVIDDKLWIFGQYRQWVMLRKYQFNSRKLKHNLLNVFSFNF